MKRAIAILLALLMVLSLAACGGGSTTNNAPVTSSETENTSAAVEQQTQAEPELKPEPKPEPEPEPTPEPEPEPEPEPTFSLGETVSTDIVDFTLEKAQFSLYASSLSTTFCEPIDSNDGGIFTTNTGRSFVCITYTIKNKDRGDINFGDSYHGWLLNPKVTYHEEDYYPKTFDLNNKDGDGHGITLRYALISWDGGESFQKTDTMNKFIDAGRSLIVQTLGIITMEPDNLSDGFEMTVNLPNSSGETEYFTYKID